MCSKSLHSETYMNSLLRASIQTTYSEFTSAHYKLFVELNSVIACSSFCCTLVPSPPMFPTALSGSHSLETQKQYTHMFAQCVCVKIYSPIGFQFYFLKAIFTSILLYLWFVVCSEGIWKSDCIISNVGVGKSSELRKILQMCQIATYILHSIGEAFPCPW